MTDARPAWDDSRAVADRKDREASERAPSQRGRRQPPRQRPVTPSDQRDEAIRRACAAALTKWIKGSIDLSRKFRSLKQAEADNMAQAVISEFIVQASQHVAADPAGEVELKNLLWG